MIEKWQGNNIKKSEMQERIHTLYRTLIKACRTNRNQCKYFKLRFGSAVGMGSRNREKYRKSQAKVTVLTGIINTLENDFGLRVYNEKYNETLRRTRDVKKR